MSASPDSARSESARPRWNGEPCEARRVRVIVADDGRFPKYWARQFVGQERAAVEITYADQTFYIDDEGYEQSDAERETLAKYGLPVQGRVGFPGWGWAKVMNGGGPRDGHASLEVDRVVCEVPADLMQDLKRSLAGRRGVVPQGQKGGVA